jgi:hypothetical protein
MPSWQTDGNPDADIGANSFLGTRSANDPLRIRTGSNVNNADAMTITPAPNATTTGNVGIGTRSPERWRLAVQGGELVSFKNTTGATKWHINDWNGSTLGSGDLNIAETGVADGRLYLEAGGNVGIGTNAPRDRLQIGSTLALHEGGHAVIAFGWAWNNGTPQVLRQGFPAEIRWAPLEGSLSLGIDRSSRSPGQTPATASILTLRSNGNVEVAGDIQLLNADCAEDFDVAEAEDIEPGTVMVIDQEGTLKTSEQPYDKRVAGVVSGAGGLKPGIILDKQESDEGRLPVALMGKVACKVDATYSPIEVGDLLTTSPSAGYAMKAKDSRRAFGAVLGKALRALNEGTEAIPVMVALQ